MLETSAAPAAPVVAVVAPPAAAPPAAAPPAVVPSAAPALASSWSPIDARFDAAPPSSRAFAQGPTSAPLHAALPIQAALVQVVRVGSGTGPLWAFLTLGAAAIALCIGLMSVFTGLAAGGAGRGARPSPGPSASAAGSARAPSPSAQAPTAEPAPPPASGGSVAERAARGEADALTQLDSRPASEISVDEALAAATGRAVEKRRSLDAMARKADADPAFAASSELSGELKRAVSDPDTAAHALGVMAKLPGTLGPDLLHASLSGRKKTDPLVLLAESLLATEAVRKKASPALAVVLELRNPRSCEAAKEALVRAVEHGDRRAVGPLGRLAHKAGCGEGKRDDCYPCLREGDELKNAAKTVGKRPGPKL